MARFTVREERDEFGRVSAAYVVDAEMREPVACFTGRDILWRAEQRAKSLNHPTAVGSEVRPSGSRGRVDACDCPRCGCLVPLHAYHWVTEVCPDCLQCFAWAPDDALYVSGGFWPDQTAIRANIAAHAGRYVPDFGR